jgi:glycosyltransferase involved in cell wall biosynthesis
MKISIAMATYNGAKYLQEQLDSFTSQTRLPDELIVCDDGSNDNTTSIIEEFSNSAPFAVRLIKNPKNLGFIKNFEQALSLCSGDLIFFSDQDDVWFPGKIEYVEKAFEENKGRLLIIHDGKIVDEQLQWHGATKLEQVLSGWSDEQYFVTGALSVLHKDLNHYILPFPDGISVGHDVWIHLIAKFLDVRLVIRDTLQLYRRHNSNTSNWIASSITKINKFTVFQSYLKTDVVNSYQDRIYLNECLIKRLKYIQSKKNNNLNEYFIDNSLKHLSRERLALYERDNLVKSGFFARKWHALRLLFLGNYKHFNGFMSFLRDFFRS